MTKKALMMAMTAGLLGGVACDGINLQDELGYERPPPTNGSTDTQVGRCRGGSGTSGDCECASGVSGCTPTRPPVGADAGVPDSSVTRPDSGVADSGVGPDAGPPCNEHTFEYRDSNARTVWVTGTFTTPKWATTPTAGALELKKSGSDRWSVTKLLPEGAHQYKFIIDGSRWTDDPSNPGTGPDRNSQLKVCGDQGPSACGDLEEFDWRDAVMYFALIDRFFDGDSSNNQPVANATGGDARNGASGQYEGGDLKGLMQKIPYLADLGTTVLWMSAPFENRNTAGAAVNPGADPHLYSAYHGYWPSPANVNFSDPNNPTPAPAVESRIGTSQDLRAVVSAAHGANTADGHGMKVLLDYVMHHVDIDSELYKRNESWFARDNGGRFRACGPENLWDDPYWGTRCVFTDYLPTLDLENAAARAWSVADAVWWAKAYGIDGYRFDAIKHVPLVWLTDVRAELKRAIPNPAGGRFYLVGETFNYDNRDLLKSFVDPDRMLDGQFDFPFKRVACESLFRGGGNIANLASFMQGNDGYYGTNALMTTWIGNHDIPRAIHFASQQIGNCTQGSDTGNGWTTNFSQPGDAAPYERLGLAFAVMMTNPGIPLIYYGDEVGLAGGGDPDNRRMMPWDDGSLNSHQKALREQVKLLARIRAENKVLGRGQRTTIQADQDVWAYKMSGCGSESPPVIVAINKADSSRSFDLAGGPFTDLKTKATVQGGRVQIPARGFVALRE